MLRVVFAPPVHNVRGAASGSLSCMDASAGSGDAEMVDKALAAAAQDKEAGTPITVDMLMQSPEGLALVSCCQVLPRSRPDLRCTYTAPLSPSCAACGCSGHACPCLALRQAPTCSLCCCSLVNFSLSARTAPLNDGVLCRRVSRPRSRTRCSPSSLPPSPQPLRLRKRKRSRGGVDSEHIQTHGKLPAPK